MLMPHLKLGHLSSVDVSFPRMKSSTQIDALQRRPNREGPPAISCSVSATGRLRSSYPSNPPRIFLQHSLSYSHFCADYTSTWQFCQDRESGLLFGWAV